MPKEKTEPFLIRPIQETDLDAVFNLASQTGPGMTSLPADKAILEAKIQESINSFKINPTKPGNESYRFVMELDDKIVGIAAIRARVGGFDPSYSYEICKARHQSEALGVDKEVEYLKLSKEHKGASIISSLFVSPDYRSMGLGQYLSQARFLFIADFPERFTETITAEMRGVIDEAGRSPFWEGTVRHFFDMGFEKADYLSTKDKGFIADLMPQYPIYIPLLRDSVIEVIGKVHDKTKPAMKFLEAQGFARDGHVDIFDAGPRVAVKTNEIKTIKKSQAATLEIGMDIGAALVSNSKLDFRVKLVSGAMTKEDTDSLNLSQGEEFRYV
ncbi:MAG: arginine N-succinyltransferase [Candidatus Melainabacteria bacterium]|jgi:arginine N-succinyltransferase|nr:arginine N-succinyltransferase [Candidatus Melainabacteria bacterium]